MIYAIDIDDTICIPKDGLYAKYEPIERAIEMVNLLYKQGNTIKLFTARGARTGIDWRDITQTKLKEWGVLYHELLMTKPHADVFIDDKAINTMDWLRTNRFVFVIGERGSGKTTVAGIFRKKGYNYIRNDDYYLEYGGKYPLILVNKDESMLDNLYTDVRNDLLKEIKKSHVVYESTGTNKRWLALKNELSKVYDVKVVKVSSAYAGKRYKTRVDCHIYHSTKNDLQIIKDKVKTIKADYEIDNNYDFLSLEIQVEGIAQKVNGEKLVAVSGAFDPCHYGHIRYFKKAKEYGRVVAMVRNDKSVILKKGYVFQPIEERKELLESIIYLDGVVATVDEDQTSNVTLRMLKPDIYATGGDRKGRSEAQTCKEIGCEIVSGIVPTYQSSSNLVEGAIKWQTKQQLV